MIPPGFGIPSVIMDLLPYIALSAAVYGGIRSDIKGIHRQMAALQHEQERLDIATDKLRERMADCRVECVTMGRRKGDILTSRDT